MTILKELWTKEISYPEVKSTYQYVMDLRERLESTCEVARQHLVSASKKRAKHYNKSAKDRNMKVGDRVLILLPTENSKLLLQWKGLYTIVEKLGKVNYRIDMNGKIKTFHANLLKRYIDRSEINAISSVRDDEDLAIMGTSVIDSESDQLDEQSQLYEIPFTSPDENPDQVDVNPEITEAQISKVN